MTTLSGRTLGRMRTTFSGGSPDSPNSAITSSQDLFEPIWLDYASSFPEATLEFGVRVESVAEMVESSAVVDTRSTTVPCWLPRRILVIPFKNI